MPRPSFCYATCDQTRTNHHHAPHAHHALKALPKCSKKSGTSGSRAAGDADSPAGLGSSGPGASRAAKTAKRHLRYEVAFVLVYKGERDAIAAIAKAQAHASARTRRALTRATGISPELVQLTCAQPTRARPESRRRSRPLSPAVRSDEGMGERCEIRGTCHGTKREIAGPVH